MLGGFEPGWGKDRGRARRIYERQAPQALVAPMSDPMTTPTASIVIPAHNEERGIARLLEALLGGADPGEFDVVVVPNGCTDRTAEVARTYAVNVVESPTASKRAALRVGDAAATTYPRIYVDGDVVLGSADVRALVAELGGGSVLATAPERVLDLASCPRLIRMYYAVWSRLPHVRTGLFGRGVVAVSRQGNDRLTALAPVMADDLAASNAFSSAERSITAAAHVVIQPPRSLRDLVRRRIRAVTGVAELDSATPSSPVASRTSPRDLLTLARREPRLIPSIAVFGGITVVARYKARQAVRRRDFTTWQRDESSRQ